MKLSTIVAAFAAPLSVFALIDGVTITNPTAKKWWVAQSQVELAWTGTLPQFVVWLTNPDQNLLSTRIQISGMEASYNQGRLFDLMPGVNPGTGYQVELSDGVNYTNVYAVSEKFEIKPKGSAYPTNVTDDVPSATGTGASASATGNATGTAGNSTASAPATSKSSGAGAAAVAPVVGVAVAGALSYFVL